MHSSHLSQLAELLEDKGSFVRGPPSAPNQPRISFTSNVREETEEVAALLGVKYVRTCPRKYKKTTYYYFTTQLKASRASKLMKELRPFMSSSRQEHIDFALAGVVILTRKEVCEHRWKVLRGETPRVGVSRVASHRG